MPDFDTRRPQEQNVPNEPRITLVANKLRSALMASRLRALLIGGGILLFVVAVPVGLLIYSTSWLGDQDQASSQREGGSSQQTSDEPTEQHLLHRYGIASVGRCADKGSTVGQQEEEKRGEVSNGKIAFERRNADGYTDIYVIDGEGTHETRLTRTAQSDFGPAWSPNGEKIAFTRGPSGIYVMDADGANQTRLTGTHDSQSAVTFWYPVWSPDGRKIASVTRGLKSDGLSVMDADGTNRTQLKTKVFTRSVYSVGQETFETSLTNGSPVWSPTGDKLAFGSATSPEASDSSASASAPAPVEGLTGIYLINVDGTGLCKLTSSHEEEPYGMDPVWSPDGEKIAFYDKGAINVINADGSGRKELAAGAAGYYGPQWSPDGQEIAFVNNSGLYVINADGSGQEKLTGGARALAQHAWSPDGQKIAFFCPEGYTGADSSLCVINADGTERTLLARDISPSGYGAFAAWGSG